MTEWVKLKNGSHRFEHDRLVATAWRIRDGAWAWSVFDAAKNRTVACAISVGSSEPTLEAAYAKAMKVIGV